MVTGLSQANVTASMKGSDEMQQACANLYEDFAAVDTLAKQVRDVRRKVEQLEAHLNAKLKAY